MPCKSCQKARRTARPSNPSNPSNPPNPARRSARASVPSDCPECRDVYLDVAVAAALRNARHEAVWGLMCAWEAASAAERPLLLSLRREYQLGRLSRPLPAAIRAFQKKHPAYKG